MAGPVHRGSNEREGGENFMKKIRIAVLASGRGTNLQAILDGCREGEIPGDVAVVISDKEQAFALERARKAGVEALYINPKGFSSREEFDMHVADEIEKRKIDLICLAGYMRILSAAFVQRFPLKIMNIHPALLPSFPGLHGQRQAVDYGVRFSGCTVHFVDEGVDTGPVIIQAAVPVFPDDSEETLAQRILKYEHVIYRKAVKFFAEGRIKVEGRKVYIEGVQWLKESEALVNPA